VYATELNGAYGNNVNASLTTPSYDLPPGNGNPHRLRFWMWMNAQTGFDGGNLKISVNGGPFFVVPSAALSVPYNDPGIASLMFAGWSGSTYASWTRVRMNLSAYAGQRVQFRFDFASDSSVTHAGWFLDDVAVEQDPVVTLSPAIQVVTEGQSAPVTLQLAPRAPDALSLNLAIGGTAMAGSDYNPLALTQGVTAGQGQKAIAVTPIQDGTQAPRSQTVILTIANGTDYSVGSAHTATVIMLGDGGYDQWRLTRFTPQQLMDPAISGATAMPAEDGISNLVKFALGLEPFTPSAGMLPASELHTGPGGERYLQVRITRPLGIQNATYKGEISGNMIDWSDSSAEVETIVTPGPGEDRETVTFRDRRSTSEAAARLPAGANHYAVGDEMLLEGA
jgi:hypothetical protein